MLLKQIISEVKATMAMENMALDKKDIQLLRTYQKADEKEKNIIREQLSKEYREE